MSKNAKIIVGLAFVVVGLTIQFMSRPGKDTQPLPPAAELKGTPIQSPVKPAASTTTEASGTTSPSNPATTQAKSDAATPSTAGKITTSQVTPSVAATSTTDANVKKAAEPLTTAAVAAVTTNGAAGIVAAAGAAVAAAIPGPDANGFLSVGFEKLSTFNYIVPDETPGTNNATAAAAAQPDQIPGAVRALDQKLISLRGYMLPLKVEGGLVTELLIMKDQSMCCFGSVPKINEWVSVKMAGKGVKAVMDQPVTLFGKLFVGEIRENGYLVGIYRMDGEKLGEVEGL